MKTSLLKCMPHVPLRELEPELEEENAATGDDEIHAMVDEGSNENLPPNSRDTGIRNRMRMLSRKMFRKVNFKRCRNSGMGERCENDRDSAEHKYVFFNNEHGESDKEELQCEIPLGRRTETKFIHKMFKKVGIRKYKGQRSHTVDYNEISESEEEFQEGIPLMRLTERT